MSEKICGIYKIINLVNGKVYIGQSIDIYRRWAQHKKIGRNLSEDKYSRDYDKVLYRAMRKYGVDSFEFSIVEKCEESALYKREQYWIKFYGSTTAEDKGYNLNDGGAGGGGIAQMRSAYQYDLDGNFVAEYRSIKDATIAMGLKSDNNAIQNVIGVTGRTSCGYQWRYEKFDKIPPFSSYSKKKKVAMYDKKGNLVRCFLNMEDAGEYVGRTPSAVQHNCNFDGCFCGGYIFRHYENEDLPTHIEVPAPRKRGHRGRKVAQYTKDGELIKIYDSIPEAAKVCNGDSSQLYKTIHNKRNSVTGHKYRTFKGYVWKIYEDKEV